MKKRTIKQEIQIVFNSIILNAVSVFICLNILHAII